MESVEDDNFSPPRKRCEDFKRLPSQETFPTYYEVVKNPICIQDIVENAQYGGFESVEKLKASWTLLFENAKLFNLEDSQVYQDACILEVCYNLDTMD